MPGATRGRRLPQNDEVVDQDERLKINAPHLAGSLYRLPQTDWRFVRIGGQNEHNDGYSDKEDSNHWGTAALLHAINQLADLWNYDAPAPPGTGCTERPILHINDMSLELGGRYDISFNWAGSHVSHRGGEQVDIRSARQTAGGVPVESEKDFYIIARFVGFNLVGLERQNAAINPPAECDIIACTGCAIHWHLSMQEEPTNDSTRVRIWFSYRVDGCAVPRGTLPSRN